MLCAFAADARADKKKAGLFDIDWWKPPVRHEHNAAQTLAPKGLNLTPGGAPQGEARAIRLRVYADRDYRGVVIRWQSKVRTQIQRINTVVGPVFNVRFEIESLRDWDRSHAGVPLGDPLLDELMALDAAREVDLVIGLVTPLQGVATSAHSIGLAAYLSRHFVLRGMDDEQEFRAFEREFKLISGGGAAAALHRPQGSQGDRAVPARVGAHARPHPPRRAEADHEPGLRPGADRVLRLRQADRGAGRRRGAWRRATSRFPKARICCRWWPRCRRRRARRANGPTCWTWSAGGSNSSPPDATSATRATRTTPSTCRPPTSTPSTGRSPRSTRVARRTPGSCWRPSSSTPARARSGGNTWLRISELAFATGALTQADEAAGRAGKSAAAQKLIAEIESTRHRIALPLDAAKLGVPPEREPAYVAGFYETAKLISESDGAAARARLGELATAFPDAPGVDVLTCDIELRAKHVAVAAKHCEAALAKFKGATRAHYFLALIAVRARREPVAEQHLRQAILLDPTDPTCWRALARFYRETRASKRLADLANEHQALLSSPLPE